MSEEKMQEERKLQPLNRRFTLIMIALLVGTLCLTWILNTFFLSRIYQWNKLRQLTHTFDCVNAACEDGTMDSDAFDIEFERLCANGNLMVIIINSDYSIVRSSVNDNRTMLAHFMELLFDYEPRNVVLRDGDIYMILRQNDRRMDAEYLVMWGTLADGKLIMARTALESIHESAKLTNKFLFIIGLISVLVGAVLIGIVTKRITNPLMQLVEISRRMTQLDFEAKYEIAPGCRRNEIDLLGEHMNKLSKKLEQTISELKSANNELMLDNERKTQIDEMRKEFLSNVSHELKTPLALIQGYAEGLEECINDDAESRAFYCEVIMDEADKMNQMVKKLLTLNNLEFGNDAVVMERFDLTELIQGVLHASSILIQQNEITVHFDDFRPIYVWADEFKVEEVVTNFLSNAIHYAMYEKRIEIYYTMRDDCVRVSVFNTGDPIPEEDLDKLWIKFYKVDKARTREYGGSGIGLSIVKAIMDSLHRQCGVCNREGGVEFWFELDTKNEEMIA